MNRIASIAAEWIDTPFVHQQAAKGAGCDCGGLLRGVYAESFDVPLPPLPLAYKPDWFKNASAPSILCDWLDERAEQISKSDAQAGDVLVFKFSHYLPAHSGILIEPERFVHCMTQRRVMVARWSLSNYWGMNVAFVYRFKGADQWQ